VLLASFWASKQQSGSGKKLEFLAELKQIVLNLCRKWQLILLTNQNNRYA